MLTLFVCTSILFCLLAFAVCMGLVFYAGGMANGPDGQNARSVKRLNTLLIAPALAAALCLALGVWSYCREPGVGSLGWYLAWVLGTVALFRWVHLRNRQER